MPAHNGVTANAYPCRGSQIPWSQMMSMNISPPRPSAPRKLAKTPAEKARILKSWSRNIGSSLWSSIQQNTTRNATPIPSSPRTTGLVQPMG